MRSFSVFGLLSSFFFRLFFAAIFGVFATGALEIFFDPPWHAWSQAPEELARERLDHEQHVAETLGFRLDRVVPLPTADTAVPIDLHAGECVAVIVSVWGPFRPSWLALAPHEDARRYATDTIAAQTAVEGLVAHVQLCASEDARAWPTLAVQHIDYRDSESPFVPGELRILRAPLSRIGSPERLNRGWTRRARSSTADADGGTTADAGADALEDGGRSP